MAEMITKDAIALGGIQKTVVTLYDADGTLTENVYTLLNCVEGTTSIVQEEGSSSDILNEQGGVILPLSTPGTRSFTTNTGDLQPDILKGLFGYREDLTTKALISPIGNPNIAAKIEVYFAGGNYRATCYKVMLNTSLTIESLKEGIAQGVITGKLVAVNVATTGDADIREFSIDPVTVS